MGFPTPLPWSTFPGPLERAEDAVARLDERVRHHPLAEGWAERAHFADACAALWLQGALVHLEDLVLRDAGMDVRMAADGTNRAMTVLRARRLMARRGGAWALSFSGLDALRGRRTGSDHPVTSPRERSDLVYDRDWDEEERLAEWRDVVKATDKLPALVAAAIAFDAWCRIAPLQHAGWIGSLLVSALLQTRGKTRHHLAALNVGMRAAPYRQGHVPGPGTRCGGNIPERPQAVGWLPRIPIVLARERDVLPAERRDVGEQFVEDNDARPTTSRNAAQRGIKRQVRSNGWQHLPPPRSPHGQPPRRSIEASNRPPPA